MPENKAYLYWIHLDSHENISEEGYVGVTTNSLEQRFQQHKYNSFREEGGVENTLRKAFKKYGESYLKFTPLLQGDASYVFHLENLLRPEKGIGWNVAIGGNLGNISCKYTEKQVLEVYTLFYLDNKSIKYITGFTDISDSYIRGLVYGNSRLHLLNKFLNKHGLSVGVPNKVTLLSSEDKEKILREYYLNGTLVDVIAKDFKLNAKQVRYFSRKGTVQYRSLCDKEGVKDLVRVIKDKNTDKILSSYEAIKNVLGTANHLKLDPKTVKKVLSQHGVETTKRNSFSSEDILEALSYIFISGLTVKEVSCKTRISVRNLNLILKGDSRKKEYKLFKDSIENT